MAVGGLAAAAFFMKGGALNSSLSESPVGEALMNMARTNPLYEGPGMVTDNPLYDPSGAYGEY